jgi:hypothetical protein
MGEFQVVGVPADVMADSRVQDAVAAVTRNPEKEAATVILDGLQGGLERYGIKLRTIGLAVTGPMMIRMLNLKPSYPETEQMTGMLFILGAPLKQVYAAIRIGEEDGCDSFLALAAEWVLKSGIPMDFSQEVVQAISETFRIAGKLIGGKDDGEKKG